MIQMMNRQLAKQHREQRTNAMIISTYPRCTPYTFDKTTLEATFYEHSTCTMCNKPIFRMVDTKGNAPVGMVWVHTVNESAYCFTQYSGLRDDSAVDYTQAKPIFGPVNLELMWQ